MNKSLLIIALAISLGLVYFAQAIPASGNSFGFEKNIDARKGADAESVAGCMQSCKDMLAGLLEMNPNSPNYTRQQEKIQAKAQQCIAMNTLAGSPFTEAEILASCGLAPRCVAVDEGTLLHGVCTPLATIGELGLPQCCTVTAPGGVNCGADAEWVVGVAAFPVCYVPGS